MSKRPWMPLYIADCLSDTEHLSAAETGAYMMLIMHYWKNGGLNFDDEQIRRLSRMTTKEWKRSRDTIAALFGPKWTHKRVEAELAKAADISTKRRTAFNSRRDRRSFDPTNEDTNEGSNDDDLYASRVKCGVWSVDYQVSILPGREESREVTELAATTGGRHVN
jgi:uncharacterized protein YdaU (DUF1376 family)